ncbi:hypothetical protein D8674_033136 [Pyrus ussuriensis x Pyrus communis]|uniref:Uncharacterized protein n=1 Tax=Pyrus ussuriensis x Pyrus communis TaxID=2448454 RepID=A0A5N5HQ34_9ROSA|nr:hypothetical protein D8674_033136 [Pyrus ussuriensis x Pyrus communis]
MSENLNGLQASSPLSLLLAMAASKALYSNPLFDALKFGVPWGGCEPRSISRSNWEPHGKIDTSRSCGVKVVVVGIVVVATILAETVATMDGDDDGRCRGNNGGRAAAAVVVAIVVVVVVVVVELGCDFEELVNYEEDDDKASDSTAKVNGEAPKNSGFKDFLLKTELLQSIVDFGFDHPSEDEMRMKIVEMGDAQELVNMLGSTKDDSTRNEALKALTALSPSGVGVADGVAERERANRRRHRALGERQSRFAHPGSHRRSRVADEKKERVCGGLVV